MKRSQDFHGYVEPNVIKFVEQLPLQLENMELHEADLVSILAFLREF